MSHQAAAAPRADSHALVIIGASARALASSAVAAGWQVDAADLFADLDLCRVARRVVCVAGMQEPYPASLAAAARRFAAAPWCYTGALENHPHLIDAIAAERPLAGNDGGRVRAVRDHAALSKAVRSIGLAYPDTLPSPDGLPTDGSYLVKPMASAGGRGIARWHGASRDGADDRVWQRHVPGIGVSAAYVCSAAGARLWGIAHQHTGLPWCHAGAYTFCAAVCGTAQSPLAGVTAATTDQFVALGAMLASRFRLVGAVGVDAVIDAGGTVWVLEVNPRPTASMELHERATGESTAALHLHACGLPAAPRHPGGPAARAVAWAKAVLHAPREIAVCASLFDRWQRITTGWTVADGGWPSLADVPAAGQTIRRSAPWMTLFAAAEDPQAALAMLERRAAALTATLPPLSPPSAAAIPSPAAPGSA
jgi:predicted ATP-grasp superfamily ATP-dependent carboligase